MEEDYLHSSSGLFLQATSIISGTCHQDKQELERASRMAFKESPKKSARNVCNLPEEQVRTKYISHSLVFRAQLSRPATWVVIG